MKTRKDYITNSSSSSFIIDKNSVDKETLKKILIEIMNLEEYYSDDDDIIEYTMEDWETFDDGKEGLWHYRVSEGTEEFPIYNRDEKLTHHYLIDNDGNIRYYWNIIEDVLDKYGIYFQYGYCD